MNNLILMLLLADYSCKLHFVFSFLCVCLFVGFGYNFLEADDKERKGLDFVQDKKRGYKFLYLSLLCLFILVLIPKQKTIYLIAGIKATESVVQSELGAETQKVILKKLKEYNEGEKK